MCNMLNISWLLFFSLINIQSFSEINRFEKKLHRIALFSKKKEKKSLITHENVKFNF